jgi:vacuolar-type H+-ATPase subunit F/Vma7
MSRAAVIGETLRAQGYALAGALVCAADDQASVLRAWQGLPGDVVVVVLTATAAGWLGDELARRPAVLPVVMPG